MRRRLLVALLGLVTVSVLNAEEWPEWRGKGRQGIWGEDKILARFPAAGLTIRWRVPIHSGFGGPAVAGGRVFVTDFSARKGSQGIERALCLSEKTGRVLWTKEWEVDYTGLMSTYATGPRATPTVDDGLVYVLGAKGKLLCLEAESGGVRWEKDLRKDYGTDIPVWGMVAAPLVEGETLISLVGGRDNAKVVAYNKRSGKELWRSLSSETELGYSPPLAIDVRGQRQIIIWHPQGVASLDPATGKIIWEQPFKVEAGLTVATPVRYASFLLLSSFYNGSMLLNVVSPSVQPQVIWKGKSQSEIETDSLHSLISTPIIQGDYIYGVCSYGQFRCLELKTGARVWETLQVTKEKARWATAFIVQNGDRLFINNDRGELVIGKVSPKEFTELSRTQLIKPTSLPGNRRELSAVNWSHPAYANRHIFARNDEEVICASLERE